jgi:hypothetical protein
MRNFPFPAAFHKESNKFTGQSAGDLKRFAQRFHITTAVSQLLYPEAAAAKWHFPQENATLCRFNKGTQTVEPL